MKADVTDSSDTYAVEADLLNEYSKLSKRVDRIYIPHDLWEMKPNNEYLYLLYKDFLFNPRYPEVVYLRRGEYFKAILRLYVGENSIFHQHWLEIATLGQLVIISIKLLLLCLYRLSGGKIVWTVHNKYPHHQTFRRLNCAYRRVFARLSHKLHVHCREAIDIMQPVLGKNSRDFFVYEHPMYPAKRMDKKQAQKELLVKYPNIAPKDLLPLQLVYLIFGKIAEYKGIREIIEAWPHIASATSVLLIVGQTKGGENSYAESIEEACRGKRNVLWLNEHVPTENVPIFFNLADAVLFNYKEILTSGGVMLAASYGKKVILPRKGCLAGLKYGNKEYFSNILELSNL